MTYGDTRGGITHTHAKLVAKHTCAKFWVFYGNGAKRAIAPFMLLNNVEGVGLELGCQRTQK